MNFWFLVKVTIFFRYQIDVVWLSPVVGWVVMLGVRASWSICPISPCKLFINVLNGGEKKVEPGECVSPLYGTLGLLGPPP